jgi:pimeloyl-ACP methyl ester carboxylesterase
MSTFLVAHGSWSAGWVWKKMRPLMAARGHALFTPTYTGIGERSHLAHKDINLETHIEDVLQVLKFEDLRDVILIGHSYGGMVATGVADRARERIKHLVYLDAYAPEEGKSSHDYSSAERRERQRKEAVDGWKVPVGGVPADTSPEDKVWLTERRTPQPIQTYEQKFRYVNGPLTLPRTFIYAKTPNPGDPFRPFMEKGRREGWKVYEIDSSHSPHVTAPEELMRILDEVAGAAK